MSNRIVLNLEAENRATPAFEKFQSGITDNLRKAAVAHKTFADRALASVKSYERRLLTSLEPVKKAYSAVDRSIRTVNKAFEANRRSVEEALKPLDRLNQELSTVHRRLKQVLEVSPNGTNPTGGAGSQKFAVQQAGLLATLGRILGVSTVGVSGRTPAARTLGRVGKALGIGVGSELAADQLLRALTGNSSTEIEKKRERLGELVGRQKGLRQLIGRSSRIVNDLIPAESAFTHQTPEESKALAHFERIFKRLDQQEKELQQLNQEEKALRAELRVGTEPLRKILQEIRGINSLGVGHLQDIRSFTKSGTEFQWQTWQEVKRLNRFFENFLNPSRSVRETGRLQGRPQSGIQLSGSFGRGLPFQRAFPAGGAEFP